MARFAWLSLVDPGIKDMMLLLVTETRVCFAAVYTYVADSALAVAVADARLL